MSSCNLLSAIKTGFKALETTGNPYVALGAAAIGGFDGAGATAAAGPASGGDSIGSLLGNLGGSSNTLKSLADQKPVDFANLIS